MTLLPWQPSLPGGAPPSPFRHSLPAVSLQAARAPAELNVDWLRCREGRLRDEHRGATISPRPGSHALARVFPSPALGCFRLLRSGRPPAEPCPCRTRSPPPPAAAASPRPATPRPGAPQVRAGLGRAGLARAGQGAARRLMFAGLTNTELTVPRVTGRVSSLWWVRSFLPEEP